jgi:hypothetical protein
MLPGRLWRPGLWLPEPELEKRASGIDPNWQAEIYRTTELIKRPQESAVRLLIPKGVILETLRFMLYPETKLVRKNPWTG